MPEYQLNVTLTLQGPILTHSTAVGESGVSSPFARNQQQQCYVPGTLVKGKLRDAWRDLSFAYSAFQPDVAALLGEESGNAANGIPTTTPLRGVLRFQDFVDVTERPKEIRYRIKLDEQRGAVSKGAYQVLEAPYQVGEQVNFQGQIQFRAADLSAAQTIQQAVERGLRWITSFGAERTVGFGKLLDVAVTPPQALPAPIVTPSAATGEEVFALTITPTKAFCLAGRRLAHNIFESETIISGSVLKGCLATSWLTSLGQSPNAPITATTDPARPELCRHFEQVRFTHAFPAPQGSAQRPVVAPLSLVKAKDQLYDVALQATPILIHDEAPAFAIDWKSNAKVQEHFGWKEPQREMRVRTAIDAERRKAKDEQLFAYEMVRPEDVEWHASLDLSAVPADERLQVETQLRGLLGLGLHGFGKTKADAEVQIQSVGTAAVSQAVPQDGLWIVTLQTPTLLCDPRLLDETSGHEALMTAYSAVWAELSSQSLRLERFFAQQSLAGGFYLYRRFQGENNYTPYLLTDPGSVFVLSALDEQAEHLIRTWTQQGLPLPAWAESLYGSTWQTCPYIRANGFGEIAVNLPIHWENQPKEGEYYAI